MGNLAVGAIMVFFIIIMNAAVAFIVSEGTTTPNGDDFNCDLQEDNTTSCQGGSPTSYLSTFFDVAVSGFSGVAVIDGFYILIVVGILVIGIALIVAGLIGIPLGSG